MEPVNKEIGQNDDTAVMQPGKVTESLDVHQKNNMQKYAPQNGGEIAAGKEQACYDDSM
jgi:hypothetical protein